MAIELRLKSQPMCEQAPKFGLEELRHEVDLIAVASAVHRDHLAVSRIQRHPARLEKAAFRTADHRARRHIAVVVNIPDAHESLGAGIKRPGGPLYSFF